MRKQFDFYGYCSPTSGIYRIDGYEYFYGEDYRNVKRYKEYKNVGFNVLLLQHENSYSGEEFQGSACEKCMTEGFKAGLDRIIVSDTRIKDLCIEKTLVGEGGKFATQAELESYLEECTAPYRNIAGFYGVQMFDEPHGMQLPSYGLVWRTLKKLYPNIYLQGCLLPLAGKEWLADEANDDFEAYDKYLRKYVEECQPDHILFDEYPFRRQYIIGGYTLRTYQVAAKICKEKGLELRTVLQSFSWARGEHIFHRRITKPDMLWQTNMAMGFGVREYSFFTYFTKPNSRLKGLLETDALDGAGFINRDGSRTRLYDYTKAIIAQMKKFARVLLQYNYENSYLVFEKGKTAEDFDWTKFAEVNEGCPLQVEISNGVALITEQKGKKGKKLYMVENYGNVKDEIDGKAPATLKVTLPNDEKIKRVYINGKRVFGKNKGQTVEGVMPVGNAFFIEVFKK